MIVRVCDVAPVSVLLVDAVIEVDAVAIENSCEDTPVCTSTFVPVAVSTTELASSV